MVQALVGCLRCGYVARSNSFAGARRECPDCGSGMQPVSLAYARTLARHRREFVGRRTNAAMSADAGLSPPGPEIAA